MAKRAAVTIVGQASGRRNGAAAPFYGPCAANQMIPALRGCVLLAGRGVARAFDAPAALEYFEWFHLGAAIAATIPHPSGVNRWWNAPDNRERARAFLGAVLG